MNKNYRKIKPFLAGKLLGFIVFSSFTMELPLINKPGHRNMIIDSLKNQSFEELLSFQPLYDAMDSKEKKLFLDSMDFELIGAYESSIGSRHQTNIFSSIVDTVLAPLWFLSLLSYKNNQETCNNFTHLTAYNNDYYLCPTKVCDDALTSLSVLLGLGIFSVGKITFALYEHNKISRIKNGLDVLKKFKEDKQKLESSSQSEETV